MRKPYPILLLPAIFLLMILCGGGVVRAQATAGEKKITLRPPERIRPIQFQNPFTIDYDADVSSYHKGKTYPSKLHITLSYNGNSLLFRARDGKSGVVHTVLYTDRETYICDSNSRIAQINAGFNLERMMYCPIPAIGLPNAPLIMNGPPDHVLPKFLAGLAKQLGSEPNLVDPSLFRTPGVARDYGVFISVDDLAYNYDHSAFIASACVVSVLASGTPKVIWYETFDNPSASLGGLWEYFDHRRFQGMWLATKIRMRRWAVLTDENKNVLMRDARYDLKSAIEAPLEPAAFDPITYLLDHANITDFTGTETKSFVYYKTKGPLSSQRGTAFHVEKALARTAPSQTNIGLIGFIVVLVMFGVGFSAQRIRAKNL